MVRRANCGLPMPSQQRFARRTLPLSLSGEEAQHASLLRADNAPRCFWSSRTSCENAATARGLSPSSHSRGATWRLRPPNAKPVPRVTQHGRVGACCLWRVGTSLEVTVCVLHAAQVEAVPCVVKPRCDGEMALSFGAHPCCDVPPAASQRQASAVRHAAQARRRSLSQGRRRSKQAYCCCARRVALVVAYLCFL